MTSADLQKHLGESLQASLDVNGSPEYEMTWKRRVMQSGAPICRLAARARRKSDSDSSGLLNGYPRTMDTINETPEHWKKRNASKKAGNPNLGAVQLPLSTIVQLVGCPTPKGTDGDKGARTHRGAENELSRKGPGSDLPAIAAAITSGYATPNATDGSKAPKKFAGGNLSLPSQAKLAGCNTPTENDCKQAQAPTSNLSGQIRHLSSTEMASIVASQLNPHFSLWLMGFPAAWGCCGEVAMQSARKSRRRS